MKLFVYLLFFAPHSPFFLDRSIRHDAVEDTLLIYFKSDAVAGCKECLFADLILPPGDYATEKEVLYSSVGTGFRPKLPKGYKVYIWTTNNYRFDVICTAEGEVL